jgi:PIN domain nuclease of toxin-antitoxin system
MTVCLDSWVVLAWLDGDSPACERVEAVLAGRPVMSWVNAVEVYYRLQRDHGRRAADDVLSELRIALDLELPGTARMMETARLKARLPIALGDCFAVATAAAHGLPLLTGDPEILERNDLPCQVVDLRGK